MLPSDGVYCVFNTVEDMEGFAYCVGSAMLIGEFWGVGTLVV